MNRPTWRKALSDVYACSAGRRALAAVVGDLDEPMPCDWPWALAVLSSPGLPTREYVGWGVGCLVDPCDAGVVAGAYLRGANLAGACLAWANLAGANLAGAYLRGADLTGANLAGANLYGAFARRAYLAWANLRDADLRDADLWCANLAGANLEGANLAGADLRDANLAGALRDPSDPSIAGWVVVDGLLRRATP